MYDQPVAGYGSSGSLSSVAYAGSPAYAVGGSGSYGSGSSTYGSSSGSDSQLYQSRSQDAFTPDFFVDEEGLLTGDVAEDEQVMALAREAFPIVTGRELPDDIKISICADEEFAKKLGAENSEQVSQVSTTLGFALNRKGRGLSEVFVRKSSLPQTMVTLGHELGHVITRQVGSRIDEEAKAFSFARAWVEGLRSLNRPEVSKFLRSKPALNGVHNVAFDFVEEEIKGGMSALQLYIEVASGRKNVPSLERIVISG